MFKRPTEAPTSTSPKMVPLLQYFPTNMVGLSHNKYFIDYLHAQLKENSHQKVRGRK